MQHHVRHLDPAVTPEADSDPSRRECGPRPQAKGAAAAPGRYELALAASEHRESAAFRALRFMRASGTMKPHETTRKRVRVVSRSVPMSAAFVTLVGGLALGMVAAPSHAAVRERGELIAFAAGGGEEPWFISTIKPNGTNRRRLIGQDSKRFRLGPSDPEWSPDGKKLLFGGHYHLDHAAQSLWYSTASGKRITRVPLGFNRSRRRGPHAVGLYGWDWAPDGRRVVFAARKGPASTRLYTISIDGRHRRALRRGFWPQWSSDGRHIVFTVANPYPYGRIAVMRPNGSGFRILADSGRDFAPRLSPDGQRVLFSRYLPDSLSLREWHMVDVTRNNDVVVGSVRVAGRSCSPGWTPDGSRLAAARVVPVSAPRFYVTRFLTMDVNGADRRRAFSLNGAWDGLCDFSWRPPIE